MDLRSHGIRSNPKQKCKQPSETNSQQNLFAEAFAETISQKSKKLKRKKSNCIYTFQIHWTLGSVNLESVYAVREEDTTNWWAKVKVTTKLATKISFGNKLSSN